MNRTRTAQLVLAAATAPLLALQPADAPEQPAADQPAPIEMTADLATRRIEQILTAERPTQYEIESLIDIAQRCPDPALAAVASYNAATFLLETDPAASISHFRNADRDTRDPALRAAARFNLAHALVAEADAPDPNAAPDQPHAPPTIEDIDDKIVAYTEAANIFRSVLEPDPANAEAAANTERLRRKIQQLHQLKEQIEQQQQAMQNLADQLQDLADEQHQQADQSEQQAEQNQQPSESDQSEQQQTSEQTEQAQQQSQQSGAPQETNDALERARQAQERAEQALEEGDAEAAAEAQQEAADALQEAAEQAQQAAQPQGAQQGDGDPSEQPEGEPQSGQGEQPTEQPADDPGVDPFAEALIENERDQRERRMRYLQQTGRQQVERDW